MLYLKMGKIGYKIQIAIFLFAFFGFTSRSKGVQNPTFNHLGTNDGLSNSTVNSILQDDDGFLWFCTDSGLNRFDGYSFKTYGQNLTDSTSLVHSSVICSDIDEDGDLWFGTSHGLSKYSKLNGIFQSRIFKGSEQLNNIRAIHISTDSVIWLGTNEGIIKYNSVLDTYQQYAQKNPTASSLTHNIVRAITEDKYGKLWIGTFDGLSQFDPVTEKFINFKTVNLQTTDPVNNLIISLHQELDKDILWVGTQTGLVKFDTSKKTFKVYRKELGYPGIINNTIKTIAGPYDGQLWLGTDEGLLIFDIAHERFTSYRHNPFRSNSLCNDNVIEIFKDNSGLLWLGTSDGLSTFNLNQKQFSFHPIAKIDQYGQATGSEINTIHYQKNGLCWIGGSSGLVKIDVEGREKWYNQEMNIGLESNYIHEIYTDHLNNLWVCTRAGLNLYDPKRDQFMHFDIQGDPRVSKYVSSIIEYKPDHYLVGSSGNGLLKFKVNSSDLISGAVEKLHFSYLADIQVNQLVKGNTNEIWVIRGGLGDIYKFQIDKDTVESIHLKKETSGGGLIFVACMLLNAEKEVLVGTRNGLYKLNRDSNYFEWLPEFGNADIKSIEEDSVSGKLWISTSNGIIQSDRSSLIEKHYSVGSDLPIKSFVTRSSFTNENGTIFFGGIDGYISFLPKNIHEDNYVAKPLITAINVNNKDIRPNELFNERRLISKVSHHAEQIKLEYNENSIELSFSLLHFASPYSNKFSYYLENFDTEWRLTDGNYPKVNYSNLRPGEYLFKVKGANPDDIWSDEISSIQITIAAPWWASNIAFISYIAIVIFLGFLANRQTIIRTKLKNELKNEQLQHERDEELHQMKMAFFTNISHEIRTPLTLILGPVEQLIQQVTNVELTHRLKLIKRNASRLLRLVNQIMDMRKLERAKLELNLQNGDLAVLVKEVYDYFIDLAKTENLQYSLKLEQNELLCQFDKDKIDKILFNLISNAFKFSSKNGCVSVELNYPVVDNEIEFIELKISDTGSGMEADQIPHVFERFYQANDDLNTNWSGTGVGLSMSQDYAKLMDGEIRVESKIGQGSIFKVLIPLVEFNQKTSNEVPEEVKELELLDAQPISIELNENNKPVNQDLPMVLVVEDNHDMRSFICDNLSDEFQVKEAVNGALGFDLARKYNPELIISDIMMPVMDGIEFCHKIKSEFDTSHIPVILLTAKNSPENVLSGLEEGADDYVTKPFYIKHLLARAKNLINSRKGLIDKFNKGLLINTSEITNTGIDEKFISDIIDIIEEHLTDETFNIGALAEAMAMSHSAIYKKIKSISGLSGNEFIRNIRLKKAGQLLKIPNASISEIIYQVGFNNRSYFSKCFREMYDMTPKEYASRA